MGVVVTSAVAGLIFLEWPPLDIRKDYLDELAFYNKFHCSPANLLLHALTVPLEWFSTLLALSVVKLHWPVACICAALYGKAAPFSLPVCFAAAAQLAMAWFVDSLTPERLPTRVIALAVALQVVSWTVQVYLRLVCARVFVLPFSSFFCSCLSTCEGSFGPLDHREKQS
jgi:hypothetical protein